MNRNHLRSFLSLSVTALFSLNLFAAEAWAKGPPPGKSMQLLFKIVRGFEPDPKSPNSVKLPRAFVLIAPQEASTTEGKDFPAFMGAPMQCPGHVKFQKNGSAAEFDFICPAKRVITGAIEKDSKSGKWRGKGEESGNTFEIEEAPASSLAKPPGSP